MQEICLKLPFLCYKLCFYAFVVKSMLQCSMIFFLLQYVFPVKQKKRCKNKVLDTLNQMSSAFLLQDCLFTAQQTNVNHTPNTSSVNSSSCSFTSTFKLIPFTLIHSHPCLCFTREDLCFPRSLSNLIL